MSYAVIRTGGKQYRVEAGQRLKVEKLVAEIGDEISLADVLMVNKDSKVVLGKSDLAKLAVKAKVISHGRGPKIRVGTFKRRKGFHKTRGHRQDYTEIMVTAIS